MSKQTKHVEFEEAATKSVVITNCALLNRYYDERALSSLPNGYEAYFKFGDLVWGYDLIEEVDGQPSVAEIPLDKESIAGVFHRTKANYAYLNGNIVITANIPAGTFAETETHQFSAIGVMSQENDPNKLILIAATLPLWIHHNRGVLIEIVIKTARTEEIAVRAS